MQSKGRFLLIRADANTQMGTGHLMRCLALAQAWQEAGGTVQFVVAGITFVLQKRLTTEAITVLQIDTPPGSTNDAMQTIEMARKIGATWVVVDGYQFGADYQQAIKQADLNLLFIDDYGHANHYYADFVLNQNIYADEALYPGREPYTRLLLVADYVLLRREFRLWRDWQRQSRPVARKALVTLGGGDPDNQTLKVIRALPQVEVDELEGVVVVDAGNPHFHSLQSAVAQSQFNIRLVQNVTNMPELMAWADVAVSAGGSTCWELAFMGLPNLVLVLADNQQPIAEGLNKSGVVINFGRPETVSTTEIAAGLAHLLSAPGRRAMMSEQGQQLVDGMGGRRVVSHLM